MKPSYLQAFLIFLTAPVYSQTIDRSDASPNPHRQFGLLAPRPDGSCLAETYTCTADAKNSPACCEELDCRLASGGFHQCLGRNSESKVKKRHDGESWRKEPKWTAYSKYSDGITLEVDSNRCTEEIQDEFTEFERRITRRPDRRRCVGYGDFCAIGLEEIGCCHGTVCVSMDGSAFNTRCVPFKAKFDTKPEDLEKNAKTEGVEKESKEANESNLRARSARDKGKAHLLLEGIDANFQVVGDECIAHKQPCRGSDEDMSSECCGYPHWQCIKQSSGKFVCDKPDFFSDTIAWPSGYNGPHKRPVPERKPRNSRLRSSANALQGKAKLSRRYDILRKCHQASDKCRFDDQCCINLECSREKPKDKYGRCKNVKEW
ncbi:hypothetical protein BJ508DRAFT_177247 [Ascobolus immersus RN42]|uniref:Uncharacterized protein n=1 Tax=Ascobolus immersus RN42 TaxID=1160509 RepID=A0A3N4ILB6_ASCIM|nr:hypothetical protein BJ508DRAFT_177247 [Ascobolus immersus RN42]